MTEPTVRVERLTKVFRSEMAAVPLIAAASIGIALSVWKAGVRRYHSMGS
jgi:ABC-type uncharacterized transport system permease subunit